MKCEDKHRFATMEDAHQSAQLMRGAQVERGKAHRRCRKSAQARAYFCRHCEGFHITTSRPRRRAAA